MEVKDLASDTVEGFNWLESELGYTREISQHQTFYYAKTITYKKGNITIKFDCDNRESALFFEIIVATKDRNMSIQEPKRSGDFSKSDYVTEEPLGIEYKSVFDYTQNTFDKKEFMRLKNNAELQLKKRDGKKRYVEVFSQLIKVALPAIEAATNPHTT
jgi:hypothetical protein